MGLVGTGIVGGDLTFTVIDEKETYQMIIQASKGSFHDFTFSLLSQLIITLKSF